MTDSRQDREASTDRQSKCTRRNSQSKYAERQTNTPRQTFKSSTHLCITIRWGVPAVGRRGRLEDHVSDSC